MDDAFEVFDYLPLSFGNPSHQEYVKFLWEAFESNYAEHKFQFAFLSFHMLIMSFVYFEIWQMKENMPKEFAIAMAGLSTRDEKILMGAKVPFDLSQLNESTAMRFLKLLGCDNGKVGKYQKLVKERNESAHSNGNIKFASDHSIDNILRESLRIVKEIQEHSKPVVETCYLEFLTSSQVMENREYESPRDQVQEVLIHGNYLSLKDIEICTLAGITPITTEHAENADQILALHQELLDFHQEIAG